MEARQEAKLQMYRAVENYCDAHNDITSRNAAFATALNEFKQLIADINQVARLDDQRMTGITIDKNKSKQVLCERAADTASIISAYAATVGDNTLREQINFSISALLKTREDVLPARCQNIHDAGAARLDALAEYSVTQTTLDNLQTAIDDYSTAAPKLRAAVSERKTATANLAALYKTTDELLTIRLDKLVTIFKATEPDFVRTYETTRRIIKPPTTPTQLKGIVSSKIDNAPVKNALITVAPVEFDEDNPPFTAITDASGAYLIKPIPIGDYKVTAKAMSFQNFSEESVRVKLGDISHFDIQMSK